MKPENKQRFSIRKYAIRAASVLIRFAFQAQASPVAPVTNTEAPTKSEVTGEAKKSEPEEVEKKVATVEAPSAKEYKLPETGSQGSEWLIATGLMTALTAYGLSKKKD